MMWPVLIFMPFFTVTDVSYSLDCLLQYWPKIEKDEVSLEVEHVLRIIPWNIFKIIPFNHLRNIP